MSRVEALADALERGAPRTLYAVILAGLIEWAGEGADLEDCRSAARHITPAVRAHVAAAGIGDTAAAEARGAQAVLDAVEAESPCTDLDCRCMSSDVVRAARKAARNAGTS